MFRPSLRIPRAPRFGGLARPCTTPSPFALLPVAAAAATPSPFRPRSEHTVPALDYGPSGINYQNWLLTEGGHGMAWHEWQSFLLQKLNALTVGTKFEIMDLKSVLLETARDPELAHIFNYASAAHNNHFFFKHLAPSEVAMPTTLRNGLEMSFGSVETLRREMINTAAAMFGPGFVWLVLSQPRGGFATFKVMATYLAGSPYPGAHWRRQPNDMATAVGPTEPGLQTARQYLEDTAYGQGSVSAAAARRKEIAPGGIDLFPVLCLNVWDHSYLRDYGVGKKLEFAERWWHFIDWEKVHDEANTGGAAIRTKA